MKTKRDWIADCGHKERHLLARKLATEEELRLTRPGTRSAPLEQWIQHYAKLGQLLGREDQRARFLDHSEADAQVAAALTAQPITVVLAGDVTVAVHPKSFQALLRFFHVRDWLLSVLTAHYHALQAARNPAHAELVARVAAEIDHETRTVAWAACTAGPGLPFDDNPPDVIAAPFDALTGTDLFRIHQAFQHVNAGQLQALDRLIAASSGESAERPAWSIFFGRLGMKLKMSPERLMKDHALASLLATVKLAAPDGAGEALEEAAA